MAAEHSTLAVKLHPRIRFSSRPSAYIEIPDENTVMTANASAFSARVFSSKRSLRYSGTLRARLAQENHRRNRAHPIEVGRHDAIFCATPGHPHQFLSAEIGRQKGEARDPYGHRTAGGKKIPAGGDLASKPPADTEDETEINGKNRVIDYSEFQRWTSEIPQILQNEKPESITRRARFPWRPGRSRLPSQRSSPRARFFLLRIRRNQVHLDGWPAPLGNAHRFAPALQRLQEVRVHPRAILRIFPGVD